MPDNLRTMHRDSQVVSIEKLWYISSFSEHICPIVLYILFYSGKWLPLTGFCAKVALGVALPLLAFSTVSGLKRLVTSFAAICCLANSAMEGSMPICDKPLSQPSYNRIFNVAGNVHVRHPSYRVGLQSINMLFPGSVTRHRQCHTAHHIEHRVT